MLCAGVVMEGMTTGRMKDRPQLGMVAVESTKKLRGQLENDEDKDGWCRT